MTDYSIRGAGGGAPLSDATPAAPGTAAAGTGTSASRDDHVHPPTTAAQAGAVAASVLTTEGDTLYRNATVPARLAKGTAGQRSRQNAAETAPEWADPDIVCTVAELATTYAPSAVLRGVYAYTTDAGVTYVCRRTAAATYAWALQAAGADAAAARAAIGLSEAPLDAPGTWTLDAGATLDATYLEVVVASVTRIVGGYPHARRLVGTSLVARLAYVGAPSVPANVWAEVGLNNAARDGVHIQMRGDGQLQIYTLPGWGGGAVAAGDAAGTWVRLVWATRERVECSYSTAVSRPTTEDGWTWLSSVAISTSAVYGTLHAGVATNAVLDATARVSGIELTGWPQ